MTNYKVTISYDGKPYSGWQKQGNTGNTVQERIESILKSIVNEDVEVFGSGRTDAGTHATGQVANFHMNWLKTPKELMDTINDNLPETIAILNIEEVDNRFHSRLNAKSKIYTYTIWNSDIPPVFARKYSFWVKGKLDIEAMKNASKHLIGQHDFKSFTALKKTKKSTVRTITEIDFKEDGEKIIVTFHGNGFLYQMVRILIGTLIEIGEGTKTEKEIPSILKSKKRENAGFTAPSHGLELTKVFY